MMREITELLERLQKEGLPLYERAVLFATLAHQGASRKGTRIPYLSHPIEAAGIVAELTPDQELIAAAVLHDVVEDTDVRLEEIATLFGERIAYYVGCESEDKHRDLPPESTWLMRKQEALFRMRSLDRNAKLLALADKLSNLRSIERDYRNVGDAIWLRFNRKDKAAHAWLYRETAEALRELSDTPAWQEYELLVKKVFEEE